MKVACIVNEYFDRVNHMLSKSKDRELDNARFLSEMHNSMNENLLLSIDWVLILGNRLLYSDDEYKP